MSAPNYQAIGTPASATTGTCTPTNPSHSSGHFMLLIAEGNNTNFGSAPTDWTSLGRVPGNAGALEAWHMRADSGAEANPTISPTSPNHTYANVHTFTNVHQVYPIHQQANCDIITASVGRIPGCKPVVDDTMIVSIAAWNVDSAGPLASAETNSSLGSLTEREDSGTTDGNGGGLIMYTGTKAAAGLVDQTTFTLGSSAGLSTMTLALAPIADISISGSVTVDGSPAPNSSGGDPKVYLYDLTQPAASYLVLDAATETNPYSLISGGTGAFAFKVPYNDHDYIAVYVDAAGEIRGASDILTYSSGFPSADIDIFTTSGGGGSTVARFSQPGVLRGVAAPGGGGGGGG